MSIISCLYSTKSVAWLAPQRAKKIVEHKEEVYFAHACTATFKLQA